MPFISTATLANSWVNLKGGNVPSKFFSFLSIYKLTSATAPIRFGVEISFVSRDLSNELEKLFYFADNPREYASTERYWVLLSRRWKEVLLSDFLRGEAVSALDVAVICMQNEEFPADSNAQTVIDRFFTEYNIDDNFRTVFNETVSPITFSNTRPTPGQKKAALIQALEIPTTTNNTINLEGGAIAANPGELSRSTFFQTLYASQSVLKCLLCTPFSFLEAYGLNGRNEIPEAQDLQPAQGGDHSWNKIVYGAPGSGKSHYLNRIAQESFSTNNIFRVTFHPSYSYFSFIGSYKPNPIYQHQEDVVLFSADKTSRLPETEQGKIPLIDYTFVPGVFIETLIKAVNNPEEKYVIIIEEINRANVTSVFGEVFQLLDRNGRGSSQYHVQFNPDISTYLKKNITVAGFDSAKVSLPKNLYIWATMNSADQGVLPLDSAFKRRWSFEYLMLNQNESVTSNIEITFQASVINWNLFRKKLNDKLTDLGIPEDKLIAPFFLNAEELQNADSIKNKLLLYLRDDLVRHNPTSLFIKRTYSEIIQDYDNGSEVFTFSLA